MFLKINTVVLYYSVYCFWCRALPSQLVIVKINAACNANMTKSWLLILHFDFPLKASCSFMVGVLIWRLFTCLCIHVQYMHLQISVVFFLYVCVSVGEGLWKKHVYSSWYWPVSSEHSANVRCAEESCTCLAVADTAMSRGCLISPVNPISQCWSCHGKQRKRVT